MHKEMVDGFVKYFDIGEIQTKINWRSDLGTFEMSKQKKKKMYNLNNFYTFLFCEKFKGLMLVKHENFPFKLYWILIDSGNTESLVRFQFMIERMKYL